MLEVFFNPYPAPIDDIEVAKECILNTARGFKEISDSVVETAAFGGDGAQDSISCWTLTRTPEGAEHTIASVLHQLSDEERILVSWYLLKFSRGHVCTQDQLTPCAECVLTDCGLPATLLAYAGKQGGMASTISDDDDWLVDFYQFEDEDYLVPNAYGQEDLTSLIEWITNWKNANIEFEQRLRTDFDADFCSGALNSFSNSADQNNIIEAFGDARARNYAIDNNLLKPVKYKKWAMLELRSYCDGSRVFFVLERGNPLITGFYRKSEAISQDKAIKRAALRLRDHSK